MYTLSKGLLKGCSDRSLEHLIINYSLEHFVTYCTCNIAETASGTTGR